LQAVVPHLAAGASPDELAQAVKRELDATLSVAAELHALLPPGYAPVNGTGLVSVRSTMRAALETLESIVAEGVRALTDAASDVAEADMAALSQVVSAGDSFTTPPQSERPSSRLPRQHLPQQDQDDQSQAVSEVDPFASAEPLDPATRAVLAALTDNAAALDLALTDGASPNPAGYEAFGPVHAAATSGSLACLSLLLSQGAAVNARCADGQTPLHLAATHGHAALIDALCIAGADVTAPDDAGWLPLHAAAAALQAGTDVVEALLRHGAQADAMTAADNTTALHIAAGAGRAAMLAVLVQAAPQAVNAQDAAGWTPLAHVATQGDSASLSLLIAAGADVNAATAMADAEGTPVLHLAAFCGYTELVTLLLSAGADAVLPRSCVTLRLCFFLSEVWMLVSITYPSFAFCSRIAPDVRSSCDQRTPLHQAANSGVAALVPLLIRGGVAVDSADAHGRTALHIAADEGFSAFVAALLSAGADLQRADGRGQTAAHLAATSGSAGVLSVMLAASARVVAVTAADLRTPLHSAASAGEVRSPRFYLSRVLIRCGADARRHGAA
jgi:ankyrin repeat protein